MEQKAFLYVTRDVDFCTQAATYSDDDFVAEDLTARHDVEIPELGLLPPVEVELQLDCLENGERLPVDADPHLQPGVEHSLVDGDLNAKDMSCCRYD